MTDTMVRVKLQNGAEASVPAGFAERRNLERVKGEDGEGYASAYGKSGGVLGPSYPEVAEELAADVSKLKGQPLNDLLSGAGLSTDGTLAERQERLAAHQAEVVAQQGGTPGGTPDGSGDDAVVEN